MLFSLVDEDHEDNPDTRRDAILAISKSFFYRGSFSNNDF